MYELLGVTVRKNFIHLTIDELAEKLKTLTDDYGIDWSIEKDCDRDCDGYEEFNGHYNLSIESSITGFELDELGKWAERCYKDILEKS